jgi:hypothetical protein
MLACQLALNITALRPAHRKSSSPLSRAISACFASLFTATNRMAGRWAASQIALASAMSFLLPLDERLQFATHIRHSGLSQNFRPTSLSISPAVTTDGSHLFRPRGLHFRVASFPAIHVVNQKLFSPALTYVYLQPRWNIRAALTL